MALQHICSFTNIIPCISTVLKFSLLKLKGFRFCITHNRSSYCKFCKVDLWNQSKLYLKINAFSKLLTMHKSTIATSKTTGYPSSFRLPVCIAYHINVIIFKPLISISHLKIFFILKTLATFMYFCPKSLHINWLIKIV